ncbi:MAG: hypothetical protein O7J95_00140, partial [Planctomycetota bacterium]|nr:hypothetical protein [Planctomycetota bacterium]
MRQSMRATLPSTLWLALPLAGFLTATAGLTAQEFRLSLDAPETIHLYELVDVEVVLASAAIPPGKPGTQAWQISVAHDNLEIVSASTSTVILEEFLQDGFEFTEITSGASNEGFTSVVILSLREDIELPPDGAAVVAEAVYRVHEEACESGARVAVEDGLVGSGDPVVNRVSWQGISVAPGLDERSFASCRLNTYRLALESPEKRLAVSVGERKRLPTSVVLRQDAGTASRFSLAVRHEPADLELVSVSIDGAIEGLLEDDGFALLELTRGAGNSGFVVRVELSQSAPLVLPALEQTLVVAEYEIVNFSRPGSEYQTTIRFAETLRGSSGLVSNELIPTGILELGAPLVVSVDVQPPLVRGDANGDGGLDIGDPIATLGFLFLGRSIRCLEGANSNSDRRVDVSDVVYSLSHLFLGGPPPPAPY